MVPHSVKYQNYLANTYIKDIRFRNRNNNLEYMVKELQHNISHNYALIKSMHIRIKDLELEVLILRNKDTPKKESMVRSPAKHCYKDSDSVFLA